MIELFDMGKYDFYVWGSMAVFAVAMLADFIGARTKHKHTIKQIKAKIRRKQ